MFKMLLLIIISADYYFRNVQTYTNLYTVLNINALDEDEECDRFFVSRTTTTTTTTTKPRKLNQPKPTNTTRTTTIRRIYTPRDPITKYDALVNEFLFGETVTEAGTYSITTTSRMMTLKGPKNVSLLLEPTGQLMHGEEFDEQPQVHMPDYELIQRGHVQLKVTDDYMQTAVNAFFILIYGDLRDLLRLPSEYILNSARTISMMKLSREKLAWIWEVVKGNMMTIDISYEMLCKYRPLFKYISAKEMAKLNLTNPRILAYIGTHPDLNRHQVGVIASKYIQVNPNWSNTKFLNLMNNLLCGVPITNMRKINENTYLQLDHQVFYHTRACDPLQRRFFLAMMTKTQALGKAYSWGARDVTRLGLLLAEVKGRDLAAINPEAMVGISSQVMMEMQPENLRYITDVQMKYLEQKPLNIMSRKLKTYYDEKRSNGVNTPLPSYFCLHLLYILINLLNK